MADLDFEIQNEGSIVLIRPLTVSAEQWLWDNTEADAQYFGNALVVEPRYAAPILEGIQFEGFKF